MKPDLNVLSDIHLDRLLTISIPQDFLDEWYLYASSFNPSIKEDNSHDGQLGNNTTTTNTRILLNHIELMEDYTIYK